MYSTLSANTHHDVATSEVYGIVFNKKLKCLQYVTEVVVF